MYPKVSIIILNRNGREDTLECLESLYRINYPNYEVILVDNFSTDGSIKQIEKWINGGIEVDSNHFKTTTCTHNITTYEYTKKDVTTGTYLSGKQEKDILSSNQKLFILKNDKNYGFAEGNNIALRQVIKEGKSDYVLLLNNDVTVKKDFLNHMIEHTQQDHTLGQTCGVNLYYNEPSTIRFAGGGVQRKKAMMYHRGNKKKYLPPYTDNVYTDFAVGNGTLIGISILESIGLLDASLFAYGEDYDLSQRIKQKGYNIGVTGKSLIYHKINQTSNTMGSFSSYLKLRNLIITNKKYLPPLHYIIYLINFICYRMAKRVLLGRIPFSSYIKGIRDGIRGNTYKTDIIWK